MKRAVFQMEPFTCPSCIKKIENALVKQPGVEQSKVLFHSGKVRVQFNETLTSVEQIQDVIVNLGYPVLSKKVA